MQNTILLALALTASEPVSTTASAPAPEPWAAPATATLTPTPLTLARPAFESDDDPARRWNVSLFGGFGNLDDGDFTRTLSGTTEDGDASFDTGFGFGFAVGYEVAPKWQVDFEYTYRTNDIDSISVGGDTFTDGDYASVAVLFNATREFGDGPIRPYVGFGLGFLQEVDIDLAATGQEAEQDFVFAWQLKAGARYQVSERWTVFGEARLLTAMDADLDVSGGGGDTFEADYDHLGLFFGASWAF